MKARHHSEVPTNGEERVDAYEAVYERDETVGPLKDSASQQKHVKERVSEKDGTGFAQQ